MYRYQLIAIIRRLLGRDRALAPCRVPLRVGIYLVLGVISMSGGQIAFASVLATGNVTPADNPFTLTDNEGLPTDGNAVNPFEPVDKQTFFEGRHLDNNVADPNDDTNVNFDVIVGKTSSGTLLISGESALRDQDLIIGDSGMLGGQIRTGTGIVRITGFGSLYNNDPFIIPSGLPSNFKSETPRATDIGFDLYVGRAGTGTLEISAGGRAEIQDSVIAGYASGSTGSIIVDGFDSFLGSGGFAASGGSLTDLHHMIIGRQGIGYMTISNGGTVDSEAVPAGGGSGGAIGPIGAVIGGPPFSFTEGQAPDPGGSGTVYVIGTASKWIVGGTLQVGGFDIGLTGQSVGDVEGDNVIYPSQAGRGTLYVQDGGLVNVRTAIGVDPTTSTDTLFLAIGRFGKVQLAGGTIVVGGITGNEDEARPDTEQVINDGVISGSGRIETGVFRNRYYGQVRVGFGESLVVDSSSDFTSTATSTVPLSNYGLMEVIGTADAPAQLEFVRAPASTLNPIQPFFNRPLPESPTPPAFEGGLISAQHSIMRFGSGIQNEGVMAFTAGTNIVSGIVANVAADAIASPDDADTGETTQILVSGPGTQVVFEDDVTSTFGADINLINGGNIVILDQHSFANAGNIGIELSYSHPSLIAVGGDVGIGGGADLTLNFASDVIHTLHHGDAFQFISFTGDIGGVDLTDPIHPIPDLTVNPVFADIETSPDFNLLYPNLDVVIQFSNEGVYALILNPMLVGGGGGAMGPDFNGDGVVDGADLAIWLANVGIETGASVLQGDADGDGDVDGNDFIIWQLNLGPYPGAGAGSGSGLGGAVPEPTGLALLLSGSLLALAIRRRRIAECSPLAPREDFCSPSEQSTLKALLPGRRLANRGDDRKLRG